MGGFCLLAELHWEGSARAACAVGLFLRVGPFFPFVCAIAILLDSGLIVWNFYIEYVGLVGPP